jgi:hypothetical protein
MSVTRKFLKLRINRAAGILDFSETDGGTTFTSEPGLDADIII